MKHGAGRGAADSLSLGAVTGSTSLQVAGPSLMVMISAEWPGYLVGSGCSIPEGRQHKPFVRHDERGDPKSPKFSREIVGLSEVIEEK